MILTWFMEAKVEANSLRGFWETSIIPIYKHTKRWVYELFLVLVYCQRKFECKLMKTKEKGSINYRVCRWMGLVIRRSDKKGNVWRCFREILNVFGILATEVSCSLALIDNQTTTNQLTKSLRLTAPRWPHAPSRFITLRFPSSTIKWRSQHVLRLRKFKIYTNICFDLQIYWPPLILYGNIDIVQGRWINRRNVFLYQTHSASFLLFLFAATPSNLYFLFLFS
jgi:hypothetical protein